MFFYAIILDEQRDADPSHWPIVTRDDTLADARSRRQYQRVLTHLPRDAYRATFVESKSLIYAPDGTSHRGGIYQISAIGGGN